MPIWPVFIKRAPAVIFFFSECCHSYFRFELCFGFAFCFRSVCPIVCRQLDLTTIRCKITPFFTPIYHFELNGVKSGRYLHRFFCGSQKHCKANQRYDEYNIFAIANIAFFIYLSQIKKISRIFGQARQKTGFNEKGTERDFANIQERRRNIYIWFTISNLFNVLPRTNRFVIRVTQKRCLEIYQRQ